MLRTRRPGSIPKILTSAGVLLALAALALPASAAIAPPPGAAKPTPGSGVGTQAALDNPGCVHDDPEYGVYGRFNSFAVGDGPVCVKPWKAGSDNGGATSRGVTADRVSVVFVMPNDEQRAGLSTSSGTAPVEPRRARPARWRTRSTTTCFPCCSTTRPGGATSRCTS